MTSEIIRRIPLHRLLIQPDEPPMHLPAVVALVEGSRTDERPIEVEPASGGPYFVIRNGRHRFMAAVALAYPGIDCVVLERCR